MPVIYKYKRQVLIIYPIDIYLDNYVTLDIWDSFDY